MQFEGVAEREWAGWRMEIDDMHRMEVRPPET